MTNQFMDAISWIGWFLIGFLVTSALLKYLREDKK